MGPTGGGYVEALEREIDALERLLQWNAHLNAEATARLYTDGACLALASVGIAVGMGMIMGWVPMHARGALFGETA